MPEPKEEDGGGKNNSNIHSRRLDFLQLQWNDLIWIKNWGFRSFSSSKNVR